MIQDYSECQMHILLMDKRRRSVWPISRKAGFGYLLASASVIAFPSAAFSQDAGQSGTSGSQAQSSALEEVVVTASKESETLTKAPLAVSALTMDQLTNAGVVGLKDLTSAAPDVEVRTVSFANAVQVTIRGITNIDYNEAGDPAVATYVDGIYIGRTPGLVGSLYDLARVEVLRGPQGTLYGRDATGGALNVITADPEQSFRASADLSYGSYGDIQARGTINLPVSDDLAVRGAFSMHRSDGYYNTEGTTVQNYGKFDDYGGRFTALWEPSATFKWRFAIENYNSDGTPGLDHVMGPDGKPIDGLPIYNRPVASSPEPAMRVNNFMLRSRMDWELTPELNISYVSGYQNLIYKTLLAAAPDVYDMDRNDIADSFYHEANVSYDSGNLKNIFGASYFYMKNVNDDAYHLYNYGLTFSAARSAELGDWNVFTRAWGIFDQATYSLTDELRLIGGIRYSNDSKLVRDGFQVFCPISQYPDLSLNTILSGFNGPGCTTSVEVGGAGRWSSVNWKAGLAYDISDRISSYFTVTTGFKAGGINSGGTPFLPEDVTNYELGVKGHFFDDSLSLRSAFFYENYTNLQITQLVTSPGGSNGQLTTNAAGAAIYGTEIEAQWDITNKDRVSGFFNFLHATYTNYTNAIDQQTGIVYPSLDGNYLPYAPKFSGRLQYSHDFSLPNGGTLTPMVQFYVQSQTFLREFNFPIDYVASYTKTGVNLTYLDPTGSWQASVYADNLENNAVRSMGLTAVGEYLSDYMPPRTWGVRISYQN